MAAKELTVLVIDDQPGIRRLLTEVIAEEGYIVFTAANGYEGIQRANEVKPNLVLLDMKMPGMDGVETLRELKRLGLGERVIMMTAYGELDLINESKEIGACAYITKPFDIMALCRLINNTIAEPSTHQRLIV